MDQALKTEQDALRILFEMRGQDNPAYRLGGAESLLYEVWLENGIVVTYQGSEWEQHPPIFDIEPGECYESPVVPSAEHAWERLTQQPAEPSVQIPVLHFILRALVGVPPSPPWESFWAQFVKCFQAAVERLERKEDED